MSIQKRFVWNIEKNEQLRSNSGRNNVDFETVVGAIADGKILDILHHPNQEKYPNQRIFVIEINNYAYCVPFIESKNEIFLKTIFPDRKITKKYLNK